MTTFSRACEMQCSCSQVHKRTPLVVITGGPGAGKTATLELMRKALCHHVVLLPESASLLFGGGFWRVDTASGKAAAQRAIYHVQNEMQNIVLGERTWALGLCDRGTLDGLAYWPGAKKKFFAELNTSIDAEYAKYHAVIHLSSPTLETGYNYQNPLRIESSEEARRIDEKIHDVWKSHPRYSHINSSESFMAKMNEASQRISELLPSCCKARGQIVSPLSIVKTL